MKKALSLFVAGALLAVALPTFAQQPDLAPSVTVKDQVVAGVVPTVTVQEVISPVQGFIVIHNQVDGSFGPVIGVRPVAAGVNRNVEVTLSDVDKATPVLYAMLHEDTGEVGVYEFGAVQGADGPIIVDGAPVSPAFNAFVLQADHQPLVDNSVTVRVAAMNTDGFVVVHAEDNGSFGAVLGATPIAAGTNMEVTIALEGNLTPRVWPMLHFDTGVVGTYEFGTVPDTDGPVALDGFVATFPISTVPAMTVLDQVVLASDGMTSPAMVLANSVYSQGAGWLVIHADNEGAPGPVLGAAPLADGINRNVMVAIEGDITPVLWPMMHIDTGVIGEYEFGMVEGADGPVFVEGNVVTFPIYAAPSIMTDSVAMDYGQGRSHEFGVEDNVIHLPIVVSDSLGWLVIHSSVDGAPGPVIGGAAVLPGLNRRLYIEIDPSLIPENAVLDQVFPMLHYDNGVIGEYEFGAVEGADGPVTVGGEVVVLPLEAVLVR
jgi:hypothetical protein